MYVCIYRYIYIYIHIYIYIYSVSSSPSRQLSPFLQPGAGLSPGGRQSKAPPAVFVVADDGKEKYNNPLGDKYVHMCECGSEFINVHMCGFESEFIHGYLMYCQFL
jgi:hypothetical protein